MKSAAFLQRCVKIAAFLQRCVAAARFAGTAECDVSRETTEAKNASARAYAGTASAQTIPGRIPGGQAGEQAAREQRTATAEGRRPVGGAKEGGPPHALHALLHELLRAPGAQKARGSKAPRGRDEIRFLPQARATRRAKAKAGDRRARRARARRTRAEGAGGG